MTRYSKTMTESYQEVVEKLKPSDGAGAYVKDFKKSDAPQFKGKSDDKLRDMAIAAYLDDKEENMQIEGKYLKYSNLLMKKAKEMQAIDKAQNKSKVANPSLNAIKEIDKEIEKEKKKLGIKEEEDKDIEEKMMDAYAVRYHLQGKGRLVQAYKTKPDAEKRAKILKSMGGVKDVSITGPHNLNMKEDMSRYYDDTMLGLGKPKTFNPRNQKFEDYIQELKDDISEAKFEVKIKGLDTMFIDASSAGTVKANLKKMLRNPKDIESVERIAPTDMKKALRKKIAGKEDDGISKAPHIQAQEGKNKKILISKIKDKKIEKDIMMMVKQGNMNISLSKSSKGVQADGDVKDILKLVKGLNNKHMSKIINPSNPPFEIKMEDINEQNKTAYEKYTGVKNPITEGRRSNYASDDEDEEGANKNIIMQLRKSLNLRNMYDVVFDDGKKVKVKEPVARAAIEMHSRFRLSRDKLAFQNKIGKSYRDLLNALKKG
jgi:hypothetical protein